MIKKLLLIVLTYTCISCTGLSREEINKHYDCIEKYNAPCSMLEGKKLK